MGRKVRLSWAEADVSVVAELADEQNPELCEEFWQSLPFTVSQEHPVVSGESIYAWTPLVSTAPVRYKIKIVDCPIGALRYSQSTGNKLSVQYGKGLETTVQPYLGQVVAEDCDKLPELGRIVWENLFWKKGIIHLHIEPVDSEVVKAPADHVPTELEQELIIRAMSMLENEPEELKEIRRGEVQDTGTYGQYFTAWDFANGMIRDYVMYTIYPMLRLVGTVDPGTISTIYDEYDPPYSSYLGYSGLHEFESFATRVGDALRSATSDEEVRHLLEAYLKYGNRLCAWSYHYFPHYLGIFYRREDLKAEFPGRWAPAAPRELDGGTPSLIPQG